MLGTTKKGPTHFASALFLFLQPAKAEANL